ncbi:MAG: hypothetical protein IKC26_06200 [Clostridia bacterium]|nr:hypothetical protein [Clostridia bacterium]
MLLLSCLILTLLSCDTTEGTETSETPNESSSEPSSAEIPNESSSEPGSDENTIPDESSNEEDHTTDSSETELNYLTQVYTIPSVGYYEQERNGILFRVDFWEVPEPADPGWIEGTVTYTNNTGADLSCYLHTLVNNRHAYQSELPYFAVPEIEQREEYEKISEEEPFHMTLAPGESVTLNLSIEISPLLPEAFHYLTFALSENEVFNYNEAFCDFYFRVS